jgi:hypothetical protein
VAEGSRLRTIVIAETEHQLILAKMQNNIGSAVIDARKGDYEPARQAASQFFTSLRAELDKADGFKFYPGATNGDSAVVGRPR